MAALASVRFTANFDANLAAIRAWWRDRDADAALAALVDELHRVVGTLERHPRLGRDFLARIPSSLEARDRMAALRGSLGRREVREYVAGDYLLLYSFDPSTRPPVVHLLAIRHFRELSFDVEGYLHENREPPRRKP